MRTLGVALLLLMFSVPTRSSADPAMGPMRWWTCSAHGHGDDAFDRNFTRLGYGPGRVQAMAAALAACQTLGHECAIVECHPGL